MTPLRTQNTLPESIYRIPELHSGIRQDLRWIIIEILRATCPKIMIFCNFSNLKIVILGHVGRKDSMKIDRKSCLIPLWSSRILYMDSGK